MTAQEMTKGSYASVVAGMGSPQKMIGVDFTPYAVNAFDALRDMAAKTDDPKNIKYALAVEMGCFNTFVPMLISLLNNLPVIDADGSGRAVPALNTLLFHINGLDTPPLAMADGENNQIRIKLKGSKNAELAENIGRIISTQFNGKAGLAGWIVNSEEIRGNIATGTIMQAMEIGEAIRDCIESDKLDQVFAALNRGGLVQLKEITYGTVTEFTNETTGGFDYGHFVVSSSSGSAKWRVDYQNENLLLSRADGGKFVPVMTVTDIISVYDSDIGNPLTNADIVEGMNVGIRHGCH